MSCCEYNISNTNYVVDLNFMPSLEFKNNLGIGDAVYYRHNGAIVNIEIYDGITLLPYTGDSAPKLANVDIAADTQTITAPLGFETSEFIYVNQQQVLVGQSVLSFVDGVLTMNVGFGLIAGDIVTFLKIK